MVSDIAYIRGTVARWARERAGLEQAALATKVGKGLTASHINAWETGQAFPTFIQAEKLARSLHLPFAVLFMSDPPDLPLPLPDLRTVSGESSRPPSPEFLDVVNDALVRQYWYRDFRIEEREGPLGFVGKFQLNDDVLTVATDISRALGITDEVRSSCDTWQAFLTWLIEAAENIGLLVMVSSVVRHSARRALDVKEFRGFASSDPYAPLIFLNGRDARAGLVFTLIHELVHIWIAASGISSPDPRRRWSEYFNPIERYCNAVAAEVLVPERNFKRFWSGAGSAEEKIARISTFHRVSKIVSIIRARELGVLSYEAARDFIDAEYQRFKEQRKRQEEKEGGPSFWTLFPSRNSTRLTNAVIGELAGC